jgi:biotin carboxylase
MGWEIMSKRLLILNPASKKFRMYILDELVKAGFELYIVGDKQRYWAKDFAKKFLELNFEDQNATELIEKFGNQNKVNGVMTYSDQCVVLAALVAEKLGLKQISPKVAEMIRNKYMLRNYLLSKGLDTVRFYKSNCIQEILEYAKHIGFPLVIKPVNGHSSMGVSKVDNLKQLEIAAKRALEIKFSNKEPELLIEEFLDGPEVSVECYIKNNNTKIVTLTDKRLSKEPFFEEIGHTVPSSHNKLIQDNIKNYVSNVLKALEFENGIAHIEIRYTKNGPKIIEVNGRLAGDFIPLLTKNATGVNLPVIAASIACNLEIDEEITKKCSSSIEFIIPSNEGIIENFNLPKKIDNPKILLNFWGEKGELVELPPNKFLTRLGYIIAEGKDSDESISLTKSVINKIQIYTSSISNEVTKL